MSAGTGYVRVSRMSSDWVTYRPSYSDILQASGDEIHGAWRVEHQIPAIPVITCDRHNWEVRAAEFDGSRKGRSMTGSRWR